MQILKVLVAKVSQHHRGEGIHARLKLILITLFDGIDVYTGDFLYYLPVHIQCLQLPGTNWIGFLTLPLPGISRPAYSFRISFSES